MGLIESSYAALEAPEFVRELKDILPEDNLVLDEETKKPFECDGQPIYCEIPLVVALPETVAQVQQIVQLCSRYKIPIVARGAGTGLCGGAMPSRHGILLGLSKMNQILAIDPVTRTACVQPGVTNLAVSDAAKEFGLYYAPDPSSQIACSIGGNVAANSGGAHCLKYGLTVHNILSIDIVTVDGELLTVGSQALDAEGPDLLDLLIGSEGMLGITVAVTLKLLPIAPVAKIVLAGFSSVRQAGDAVSDVVSKGIIPAALEMMDSLAIKAAENFCHPGYPTDSQALLLCELDGTEEDVADQVEKVTQVFESAGAETIRVPKSDAERALMWKGRKSAFPAVGQISPDYFCMDGTIPRSKLGFVLEAISDMSEKYQLQVANVFHAGDGNLHPLILFDGNIPGQGELAAAFGGEILELCVSAGGCITGEHGVGIEKLRQMPLQFSEAEIGQFQAIKQAFDPESLLNPGKGIPTLKQCQEYRALAHGDHA